MCKALSGHISSLILSKIYYVGVMAEINGRFTTCHLNVIMVMWVCHGCGFVSWNAGMKWR